MQIDPLKTRLGQLKKASVELKSKVLNQQKIDYEAVSNIINSILPQKYQEKHIKGSHQSNSNLVGSEKTQKQPSNQTIINSSSNSLTYSPVSSIFAIPPTSININKSAPDRIVSHQRSSSNDSLRSRDIVDVDIERIKKQNQDLQTQITGVSEQLVNLQRKEKSKEEDQWKENLPFLHRKGNPGIFLTKLFIKEYDYDKIDYEEGKAQILHDKLIIQLPTRPIRQYKLSTLSQAKYIGQKCLKLDFKIDETLFVFLQFESGQDKDSWDLALFVNQKIITNKELDKSLFHEVKEREKGREKEDFLSPSFTKKSVSRSSLRFDDDKMNQRFAEHRTLQAKSQKLRKSSMKAAERRAADKSYTSKASSDNKHDQSSRFFNQLQYTLNGHHNQAGQNTPNARESFTVTSDNNEKDLKELMVFGDIGESHNQSRAHTSKFNVGDQNYQNQQFVAPPTPQLPQISRISVNNFHKNQQQEELRRWQSSSNRLKSGYYFTKYARDGIRPHNKHVFISQDQDSLMCVSTDNPNQKKQILIENIKRVRYPAVDEGVKKHIKNPRMEHFCVIQYSTKGIDKFMQLGCQKIKFTARFAGDLYEFLRKKGVFMNS